jgi:hypothetical protein
MSSEISKAFSCSMMRPCLLLKISARRRVLSLGFPDVMPAALIGGWIPSFRQV